MRIYLAAPLFSQAEREYNKKLAEILKGKDFEVFLPQEFEEKSYKHLNVAMHTQREYLQ